jgi:hypothetical protein
MVVRWEGRKMRAEKKTKGLAGAPVGIEQGSLSARGTWAASRLRVYLSSSPTRARMSVRVSQLESLPYKARAAVEGTRTRM